MFESMENHRGLDTARRGLAVLISMTLHTLVILLIVVLPLVFFQMIPGVSFLTFLIADPAPPLPPPPLPPVVERRAEAGKVPSPIPIGDIGFIPDQLPDRIPAPGEEPQWGNSSAWIDRGGLGLPGLSLAGAVGIGTGLDTLAPTVAPPPPPPPVKTVITVGGKVQEARLIRKVLPVYPDIARHTRVSGLVVLEVTIDEEGNVTTCRIRQGHTLLIDAAVQAVKQWKYSPTLLNGEPVQVVSTVNLNFVLNQ
jgi:periplasmic protein TonB